MPTTSRFALPLAALLLGGAALCACSSAPAQKDVKITPAEQVKAAIAAPAGNLDESIRQAQLLRLAGSYPEAVRHLSQLMMVASDDPRVVSEYGKTLAAMGRAQESINFLTRAQQLQPSDWTVYSALGVAYDQVGNQIQARAAYERALALKPGEPSVLNNYALSRMLAKDPQGARSLAERAQIAGGASDPKIARNIAMINSMTPAPADPYSVTKPAPAPQGVARVTPAPRVPVAAAHPLPQALPQATIGVVAKAAPPVIIPQSPSIPGAATPRPLPTGGVIQASPQLAQTAPRPVASGVVMQRVPVDPLAGPVAPRIASRAPRALMPKIEKPAEAPAKAAEAKPAAPVKSADAQAAQSLQAKAEALAKQLAAKPGAKAAAMAEAAKPAAPKVLPPKPMPVKAAEAKPVPVKAAAKDTIPGLRLSANAY